MPNQPVFGTLYTLDRFVYRQNSTLLYCTIKEIIIQALKIPYISALASSSTAKACNFLSYDMVPSKNGGVAYTCSCHVKVHA